MISKIDHTNKYRNELAKLLVTMQMTLKGTPYIYQGNEIGMTNYPFEKLEDYKDVESINYYKDEINKGVDETTALKELLYGSRDHARTPMQWNEEEYAGFSKHEPWLTINPNYKTINVEQEKKDEDSILNFYRRLIRLRKDNKSLIYGSFKQIHTNKNYFCYERELDGDKYLIILNLTNKVLHYPISVNHQLISSNYNKFSNKLRPYEANIFKCESEEINDK